LEAEAPKQEEGHKKSPSNYWKMLYAGIFPESSDLSPASTTSMGESIRDSNIQDFIRGSYRYSTFLEPHTPKATVERVERVTTTTTMRVTVPPHTHEEILDLIDSRFDELRGEIMERLENFEKLPVTVVKGRDVSFDEAVTLVENYYQKHGKAFPSDVASKLGISLELVVKAIEHLKEKGLLRSRKEIE